MLKFSYVAVLLTLTFCFSACGGNDDDETCQNQLLTGQIDGQPYNFGGGQAHLSIEEASFIFFNSSSTIQDDICDQFGDNEVRIFFSMANIVGRTDLFLDLETFDGQTVTLFNPDGTLNIIATEGYIEITSFTDTEIAGYMSARGVDNTESVCGSFTAKVCN